jgi:hypothetical protein
MPGAMATTDQGQEQADVVDASMTALDDFPDRLIHEYEVAA